MTTHLKFRIGEKWICIEDGTGYAPDYPDHVTFAVRDVKANCKPGGPVAANFSVRRRTVLEIGLQLLELAERMTPETTWQNSQTEGETGQAPLTFTFAEVDRAVLDRLLADRPLNFARHAYASAERLRSSPSRRAARTRTLRRRDGRRPARADRGRRSGRRVPREADRRI
ncbi:hypothetical protein R69927_06839 [Paraburkholderia domus]|uniref:hypothetical protein n=1 Tax=Paraburkholderia domus TaxID=2793075 RepID=UPI001913D664|nr:hypothetical protein [Paraburkholderia domus]MBK5090967.1 hypothetical protein [Burkholderia sp. R-69927]CAE6925890.1 hypothetical protein R69927_06839 [Paraburkholderia domus]